MKKYKELKDYLNAKLYDDIFKECNRYFIKHKSELNLNTLNIPYPFKSNLYDVKVMSLYSENGYGNEITIKANVLLSIVIKGKINSKYRSDIEEEILHRYAEVIIKANLTDTLSNFIVSKVNPSDERSLYKKYSSYSKSLVPYMEEKDMDLYAEEFLKHTYPQALTRPMELPVNEVLNKLGLKVEFKDLAGDEFGKIYFLSDESNRIESKTILIDETKAFMNGFESTKNTIIHECVHYYFHRGFFALQKLLDREVSSLTCTKVESEEHYSSLYTDDIRWMEWQANSLAPRILMPKVTTIKKYQELYDKCSTKNNNNVKILTEILQEISDTFAVSKQLAKIRLIQLGYEQFNGINVYLNDNNASYVAKNHKLKSNETYRINFIDLLLATYLNPTLKQAISERKILFIDGFLISNNSKYVKRINNKYIITEYAFNNIDECCIKFKVSFQKRYNMDNQYSLCYLCKKSTNNDSNIKREIVKNSLNEYTINKSFENFPEEFEEDNELISKMNGTFCEAFKMLYDYYEIESDYSLAKLCHVDHNTITSYYNGEIDEPHYKKVLAICAGLCLRPRVAKKLLSTIGKVLSISNLPQDHLYEELIDNMHDKGLDVWNQCINDAGLGDEHLLPNGSKLTKNKKNNKKIKSL